MPKRVFLFFLLAWGVFAGHCVFADDPRTVTLNVSVTNPSPDQTREMDFKTDLPAELKRNDIISSDNLNVAYDSGAKAFAVQGKVNLRPGETIFYRIIVRDVWLVSEDDFAALETKAKSLRSPSQRDSVLQLLGKIKARQEQGYDEVLDHIAIYRENFKELDSIRNELLTEPFAMSFDTATNHSGSLIAVVAFGILTAASVMFFLGKSRKPSRRSPGNFLVLSEDVRVDCVLLPQGNVLPSPHRSQVKERGISMVLDERYLEHAAIEMKVFLPGSQDAFAFTGFVVQQSPLTGGGKDRFETLVSLVEAGENSYETLSQYIQTRPKD
ncbi:MAG: hypothetical protein V1882_10540 [Candidatus Omnitrophota bacterium]